MMNINKGAINGYRWGVEYPTNGKRPDLEDDVLVEFQHSGECWMTDKLSVECFNWGVSTAFRITDPRYKPADTSYLNAASVVRGDPSIRDELNLSKSLTHSEEGLTHKTVDEQQYEPVIVTGAAFACGGGGGGFMPKSEPYVRTENTDNNWHERGELPPVGAIVAYHDDGGYLKTGYMQRWIEGDELEILSHKTVNKVNLCVVFNKRTEEAQCLVTDCMRPIRTHREKVIEAAVATLKNSGWTHMTNVSFKAIDALLDAGMLVLPQDSSDTED